MIKVTYYSDLMLMLRIINQILIQINIIVVSIFVDYNSYEISEYSNIKKIFVEIMTKIYAEFV